MESNYRIENKTLYITTEGINSNLDDVKQFSHSMFELCLRNSCNKILADDRLQENNLSDFELFELAEYQSHIMPAIIKMAIVTNKKQLEKVRLWESTGRNRGAKVKLFIDLETADKWLNE